MTNAVPSAEFQILHQNYLWMSRNAISTEHTESFLTSWSATGYLVLSVTEDVDPSGDPQFLQTRSRPGPLLPADEYWRRHGALHERLRRNNLLHLPIGLGPDEDGPLALAWLVPAPTQGTLQVGAIYQQQQQVDLSAGQRMAWLLWLADQLSRGKTGTGQRVVVQSPGDTHKSACWHYGAYVGEIPVPGATCSERVRTLLAALPRYTRNATMPGLIPDPAAAADWPFLFNKRLSGFNDGVIRVNGHRELLFGNEQQLRLNKANNDL